MELWVAIFVTVAAVAIVIQTGILFGMFLGIKKTSEKMTTLADDLNGKLNPILSRLSVMLEDMQPRLSSASADAAEVAHIARQQAERIDRVFAEALDRIRSQVIRADQLLTSTLEELEDAGKQLGKTLIGPVQRVSAVLKGISAGLEFLREQRRGKERTRETQDEELFI